jgi:hypothetical protein
MKRKFLIRVSSAVAILISQTSIATVDKVSVNEILAGDKISSLVMENTGMPSLMMMAHSSHSSHSSHGSHGSHSSHSSGY